MGVINPAQIVTTLQNRPREEVLGVLTYFLAVPLRTAHDWVLQLDQFGLCSLTANLIFSYNQGYGDVTRDARQGFNLHADVMQRQAQAQQRQPPSQAGRRMPRGRGR